jgi:hypothetical protein
LQRPEGDPLAVGEAAAAKYRRSLADLRRELSGKARLPDSRGSEHRHEHSRPLGDGTLEGGEQVSEFLVTADEGGVEAAGESGRALNDVQEPISGNGVRLAFQRKRLGGVDGQGVTNESIRLLAEEDLARFRGLLEAGGDVDGIAARIEVACGRVADDDLARVDACADGQGDATLPRQLFVQLGEATPRLGRRSDGAEGVVLMCDRDAERP